jgi:hypothetical protein
MLADLKSLPVPLPGPNFHNDAMKRIRNISRQSRSVRMPRFNGLAAALSSACAMLLFVVTVSYLSTFISDRPNTTVTPAISERISENMWGISERRMLPEADDFSMTLSNESFDFLVDLTHARASVYYNVAPISQAAPAGGMSPLFIDGRDEEILESFFTPQLTETRHITIETDYTPSLMLNIRSLGVRIENNNTYVINDSTYGNMTLNVEMGFYPIVHSVLSGYGNITNEWVSTQSLDSEINEAAARLGSLYSERDRLMSYNSDADELRDVIRLHDRISNVMGQIDNLETRVNHLQSRAGMSNVTISTVPPSRVAVPEPQSFTERLAQGFTASAAFMSEAAERVVLFTVGAVIPVLITAAVIAIILIPIWRLVRKGRRI